MKRQILITALLLFGLYVFSQVISNPTYLSTNMTGRTLTRVVLTESQTKLYFTAKENNGFSIAKSSTLLTNSGQEVKLIKCEGLDARGSVYRSPGTGGELSYILIFPPVRGNVTSIDFQENLGKSGSYYVSGINLKQ